MKFPKVRGEGGPKAVWTFFKKTSIFGETITPNLHLCFHICAYIWHVERPSWGWRQEGLESWQELPIFPLTFILWFGWEHFHHCWHFYLDLCPIFVLFLFGFYHHWLSSFGLRNFASLPSTSSARASLVELFKSSRPTCSKNMSCLHPPNAVFSLYA